MSQTQSFRSFCQEIHIGSIFGDFFWRSLYFFIIIELLSLVSYFIPALNGAVFCFCVLVVFLVSVKNISTGLVFLLMELFIGGFGYLFWLETGNFRISLRLGIFVAYFFAGIVVILRQKKIVFFSWKNWKWYMIFMICILIGIFNGLIHKNSLKDIFFDMNGYLYYGLCFIFFQAIQNWEIVNRIFSAWIAAIFITFLKVSLLLYTFTHQVKGDLAVFVYRWVRDTRIGEITEYPSFYRIFFQSHIYCIFVFFLILVFYSVYFQKNNFCIKLTKLSYSFFIAMLLFIFLLGYSRSFWIGIIFGCCILCFLWLQIFHFSLKRILFFCFYGAFLVIVSIIGIGVVVRLPSLYHGQSNFHFSGIGFIEDRTTDIESEAAARSRFALLSPIAKSIIKHPIFGTGFGTRVTYTSSDPRIVAQTNGGIFTTYTFEWAYLDTWTEIGIVGLVVYLFFLGKILQQCFNVYSKFSLQSKEGFFALASIVNIFVLLCINIFTPFLNHPLGIGYILFTAAVTSFFLKKQS